MDDQEDTDALHQASRSMSPEVGERLRQARNEAGMHQSAVSEKLGLNVRSLARWENGDTDLGFLKACQLAELYGVSLDWLAGRTENCRVVRQGHVLVNDGVVKHIEQLVKSGCRLEDVPPEMMRAPGLDYAWVVPSGFLVMSTEAAMAVEAQMRRCIDSLRRNK